MHIKATCEYIGTRFSGFQAQNGKRTVQGELEIACQKFFGTPTKVVGSGRTDAGVHAVGQVISFLLPNTYLESQATKKLVHTPAAGEIFKATINKDKLLFKITTGLNAILPADISVRELEMRDKFNAREAAKAKTYIYKCYLSKHRSAARDATYLQVHQPLDLPSMRLASQVLTGTNDYTAFCTDVGDKNPTRTIYELELYDFKLHEPHKNKTFHEDELWFIVRGNGFLKNMVRIIVGVLLDVGTGKLTVADVRRILDSRDRKHARETAPAKGLVLFNVEY